MKAPSFLSDWHTQPWRVLEFTLLCVVLPTIVIMYRLADMMFFFLWSALAITLILYRREPEAHSEDIWKFSALKDRSAMLPMLQRFVISAILLVPFLYLYDPSRLFFLPREHPDLWALIMTAYPLLSATPQEFIFCTYFFARFRSLFKTEKALIIASAIVFAYAHILYINPVAPVLGLLAGYFFASTYASTRSLALVSVEHALYGNWIFTMGIGWYFWHGSITP